jgi:isopentenyl diphosphate isomerase/L-lactate dehydrogenase-like FMN-dependent dehydrogenase
MSLNAHCISDLRLLAKRRLPKFAFDFVDGGADDETTLRRNLRAFDEIIFDPQILVDVSRRVLTSELLGAEAAMPLAIAPTGMAALMWPEGEIALARAAKAHNIPFAVSTQSSFTLERIAAEGGGRLWFQLYHFRNRELVTSLVGRARDAGYEALILTVDVPVMANRMRDRRNGFATPLRPTPRLAADLLSHPRWAWQLLRHGIPNSANVPRTPVFKRQADEGAQGGAVLDPSLTWSDAMALRKLWPGRLVLKGVLSAQDTRRAADAGFDAVIVSNHGGRQLDGAPATIEVLPEIVDAAGSHIEILIDSGFRKGSDVVKALSLGAKGVLIGRPALFGLAAAGQAGVEHALSIFRSEIHRTLCFIGCPNIRELTSRPGASRLRVARQRRH